MLMLTYQKREGETISFKVREDKAYSYKYEFLQNDNMTDTSQVKIVLISPIIKTRDRYSDFIEYFPCSKLILMKHIGVWVKNQMYDDLGKELLRKQSRATGDYVAYCAILNNSLAPDSAHKKEISKLKSFIFLRSRKISMVLGGTIWREWLMKHNITDDDMKEIANLSWRLYHKHPKAQGAFEILYDCFRNMEPEVWTILKRDMSKYNVSLCKYLLNKIYVNKGSNMSATEYINLIKKAPNIVKHCKYGLEWEFDKDDKCLIDLPVPKDRWQYFAQRVCIRYSSMDMYQWWNADDKLKGYISSVHQFSINLPRSSIAVWHYFKKARHITGPYSTKEINHMIQTIEDGERIHHQFKDNNFGISLVPVRGSPMRMIRNAIYNHRQEQEINKQRKLGTVNYNLPIPKIKLPDWIEQIRIKTSHEMIKAGIECEHCIGSYTSSNDIFLREKNICLQLSNRELCIIQCFDIGDRITKESQDLSKRVNKALEPIISERVNLELHNCGSI